MEGCSVLLFLPLVAEMACSLEGWEHEGLKDIVGCCLVALQRADCCATLFFFGLASLVVKGKSLAHHKVVGQ